MISLLLAASTLLVPEAPRPVPAVVLLHGSGATDGDGTVGPNKPLADLANGLAERGIASIRVDGGNGAEVAAIREIASAPGVDPGRVFLVGHAEGASTAPRLAKRVGSVRGLVLLAPGVRPVDVRLIEQVSYGAKLLGLDPADVAEQADLLAQSFATVKNPKSEVDPRILGRPAAYWRDLLSVDVSRDIRETTLPVLVLQGEKDFEVRADLDFDALRKSVGSAKGRVSYRSFPGLNHLFMRVDGMSSGAEYGVPGHVDAQVVAAIAEWILAR